MEFLRNTPDLLYDIPIGVMDFRIVYHLRVVCNSTGHVNQSLFCPGGHGPVLVKGCRRDR